MKTINDLMEKIAKADNYSVSLESITLFRESLFPKYSRSLWVNIEPLSPLDPSLLPLVFKWKKSHSIKVNLAELINI